MEAPFLDAARAAFSSTYQEARTRFHLAAHDVRSYPSVSVGPDGEPLFTDTVWIGPRDAKKVFVMISATHGVEGYCGSACQLDWLRQGMSRALAPGTAALIIHALNPYGFTWDRRVTAEGCDLNRNFIDFDAPVPMNEGYDMLAECLVPASLEGTPFEQAEAAIAQFRQDHGELAFQVARKSGQYKHPTGMFFGGFASSEARRVLEQITHNERLETREFVIVVDYHTGLGPYGYGELQCEQVSGMQGYRRAVEIFGDSVTSPDLGTSSSVALHGTMDEHWERLLGKRHVYVCLEFGTYDPERGRRVLRQDHWLATYHKDQINADLGRRVRAETRAHYFPEKDDWKEMVIFRARQVARQAMATLHQDSG
jgi:hypothetical protein